ncbi:hypothetical protein DXG01_003194, partial [Tephrocybe rancida]
MTGTRSNMQSTTRSSLIRASGPPSSCAGRKHATSVVNEAANKKPKPAPEIKQEVSEEESKEEEKKVGKGEKQAKAPRQTRKPGANKAAKGKGGKGGARCTAADKELEEVAAVIPARLPRTEQALLDSGISVAPLKRTCAAATTSAGPTATTSSTNTSQRRTDALNEENNPCNHEGSEEGSEGRSEGEGGGNMSKTEDGGEYHESGPNSTTTGPTHTTNICEPANTRKPNENGHTSTLNVDEGRPASTPSIDESGPHVTTTGPTHALNICAPNMSGPTSTLNVDDSSLHATTTSPTRTTNIDNTLDHECDTDVVTATHAATQDATYELTHHAQVILYHVAVMSTIVIEHDKGNEHDKDVLMASPPNSSGQLQGASCTTGRVFCGRAQGNIFNHGDAQESEAPMLGPVKGKVHFYRSNADPATVQPSLIVPSMTFKQDVISNLAPILIKTAKVYSPIKKDSWIAKGRYEQAIEDNEDTVEWNLNNSELTLQFLL